MLRKIRESLHRQKGGLKVLALLLEEEFAQLKAGQPKFVSMTELAVQELMRQLMAEKIALKKVVQAASPKRPRLSELLPALGPAGEPLTEMVTEIDALEQACSKQAERNFNLALGLLDQSKGLLDYIRKEISPPDTGGYSARGRYAQGGPAKAALLRGRL